MLYAAFPALEVQPIAPGKQGDERKVAPRKDGFW